MGSGLDSGSGFGSTSVFGVRCSVFGVRVRVRGERGEGHGADSHLAAGAVSAEVDEARLPVAAAAGALFEREARRRDHDH